MCGSIDSVLLKVGFYKLLLFAAPLFHTVVMLLDLGQCCVYFVCGFTHATHESILSLTYDTVVN